MIVVYSFLREKCVSWAILFLIRGALMSGALPPWWDRPSQGWIIPGDGKGLLL